MSILREFAELRRDIERLEGGLHQRGTRSALAPFVYWSPEHRPTSIQVRRRRHIGGIKVWDRSRRFSVGTHGSLATAHRKAAEFKKAKGWTTPRSR